MDAPPRYALPVCCWRKGERKARGAAAVSSAAAQEPRRPGRRPAAPSRCRSRVLGESRPGGRVCGSGRGPGVGSGAGGRGPGPGPGVGPGLQAGRRGPWLVWGGAWARLPAAPSSGVSAARAGGWGAAGGLAPGPLPGSGRRGPRAPGVCRSRRPGLRRERRTWRRERPGAAPCEARGRTGSCASRRRVDGARPEVAADFSKVGG